MSLNQCRMLQILLNYESIVLLYSLWRLSDIVNIRLILTRLGCWLNWSPWRNLVTVVIAVHDEWWRVVNRVRIVLGNIILLSCLYILLVLLLLCLQLSVQNRSHLINLLDNYDTSSLWRGLWLANKQHRRDIIFCWIFTLIVCSLIYLVLVVLIYIVEIGWVEPCGRKEIVVALSRKFLLEPPQVDP